MKFIDTILEDYCIDHSVRPSVLNKELFAETHNTQELPQMLIGEMEASFLGFLIKSSGVKRVLEIGTFTGYSALAMARELPNDGELITLDINPKTVALAQKYWDKAKWGHKIKSIVGSALETIPTLKGQFDLVFIDADKENYKKYLDMVLPRLSGNGIVIVDNVLWGGKVVSGSKFDTVTPPTTSTIALREFNEYIKGRKDLYSTMLPVRDGLFLIKRV
ncbi:MAG: class I SAM-dependent methyltransferase [Bacteriovoracaceae bacterium]|nr:class I SAM-dependent methyltransferase [Bacteriovoracaceae bacterium]